MNQQSNTLNPSTNMSIEFQEKNLNDPINFNIALRELQPIADIPERFVNKARIVKEREALGSFKIPADGLKKRVNPSDEYEISLKDALEQRKKLLRKFEEEKKNEMMQSEKIKSLSKVNKDEEDIECIDFDPEQFSGTNENLIKLLDMQVNKLKRESKNQMKQLKNNSNKKFYFDNDVDEVKVDNDFITANDNRIQQLKHVKSNQKPEYLSLEDLEALKKSNQININKFQSIYDGTDIDLSNKMKEHKLRKTKNKFDKIQREGYTENIPLDQYDIDFIDKFENYKMGKYSNTKLDYEEEWNTTKVKSQNANGVVDRNDGLPGYLDQDDYRLYYYDIYDDEKKKNKFERPLLVHKHKGRENTLARTFRNEPNYKTATCKLKLNDCNCNDRVFYNTTGNLGKAGFNNNVNVNNSVTYVNNSKEKIKAAPKKNKENNFIKMIYSMLPKDDNNLVKLSIIPEEMNLDNKMLNELGFADKDNFANKLTEYPTSAEGYISEEEFINFLLNKGEYTKEPEIPNNMKLYTTSQNFYEDNLPGMRTDIFDFLKYESTKKRLKCLRKSMNNSRAKSLQNSLSNKLSMTFNPKNLNLSWNNIIHSNKDPQQSQNIKTNEKITFKENNINKQSSAGNLKQSKYSQNEDIANYNTNEFNNIKAQMHSNTESNINKEESNINNENISNANANSNLQQMPQKSKNMSRSLSSGRIYRTKADVNFTIPKPFEFLKRDYHAKKLEKMEEILMERQALENEVFNHTFHANPLNKKMFNKGGNLDNIIKREKDARKKRIEQIKGEIQKNMKPFSFYDKDEEKYKEKLKRECIPPKFEPFKANPVGWKSQVNMYAGIVSGEDKKRAERIHQRAIKTFEEAKLPPRMEMHEKNKKLREQENKILLEKEKNSRKQEKFFEVKKLPDFKKLQEKFIKDLENKKQSKPTTKPMPFTFHESKKKTELYQQFDLENNPQTKNPVKRKSIKSVIEKMQQKPKIEPATTKGLSLLMNKRRNDLEMKKKEEEKIKLEDFKRHQKQQRLKEKLNESTYLKGNDKILKERRQENKKNFIQKLKNDAEAYKTKKQEILQRVANRPFMFESVIPTCDYIGMGQDLQSEVDQAINEGRNEDLNSNTLNQINNITDININSSNTNAIPFNSQIKAQTQLEEFY